MEQISLLYITCADIDQARHIGKLLVEERLVACVNIVPRIESIYHWEGKLVDAAEALLLAKTRTELVEACIRRTRELHSYSCPCIVSFPLANGSPDFLHWIEAETRS